MTWEETSTIQLALPSSPPSTVLLAKSPLAAPIPACWWMLSGTVNWQDQVPAALSIGSNSGIP
ncbi:hypothetical protein RRF57_005856 [Xylaria bambusicola]|uniref:Uncharacterized protein n=1 Tax=Xylaria bambusicola TaxID=326684 RepID=A0AAN7Z9H8_9PEZI